MPRTPDPRTAGPQTPFPEQTQAHPGIEARMSPAPDYGEDSYKGLGRMKDRVALVTGGDSGIGRAVCLSFAREGADVAFGYLNEHEDAEKTQRIIQDAGRQGLAVSGDLAVEAHCRELIEKTVKRFGRIDVLVNNAAFQGKAVEKFEELDAERIERTFRVNILAMFHLARLALPHMKPGGSIINVASVQAYQPSPSILDYASTKGAIVTFTKGLAQSLIERGIRVNCVAPGPVWTPIIPQSYEGEKVKKFGENTPMGRPAQPAELAPSFVFLACDESRYVNGEILGVTGGKVLA
ncbi:glucose 1-dehydrogenase [Stigmatella aurantiaca]|uniref:Short-chain dehydrogenase/reductase SDR n=2 Tax=Stigmatella aurantiaca (strain DW4/3-1) TaxID=378806 RepID=E3FNZ6_STIAD|nr:glucose 1-dehydrogenase [Stigmatella aurantiaca]ADO69420.1 Short-chain dehydrogenase/reductase SDR [Stigmatella aurantiaca DW4/3-1]